MLNAYLPPTPDALSAWLKTLKTVAVLGLSPKEARPSYRVAQGLQRLGLRIVPVRPPADQIILGEKTVASLEDLTEPVDVVDVFRASEEVPAIVETCIRLKIPAIWLQQGVIHSEAAARAQAAGLFVVMDRCLWVEYAKNI